MAMDGERSLEGLLETPFRESGASISPDGRWLAYESNESGQTEIHVRTFPDVEGGKWLASTDGGTGPRWNPSGAELFYRDPDERLMTVPLSTDVASFAPGLGRAEVLLEGPLLGAGYDVSPDGRKFLVIKEDASLADATDGPDIIVVQNWTQELLERVPVN